MKKKILTIIFFAFLFSLNLNAKIYNISPNGEYDKPSDVVNLVADGDTIEIQAGTYLEDVASWRKNNLTFRCVDGYAHLNANGKSAESKAIWVIKGNDCKVENIEFSNCRVPDNNGAGIRLEGTNLIISHCYFHDNQDGILTTSDPNCTLIVEYSEFSNNSADDGLSHNLYINHIKEFYLRYSYIHNARVGHNVKSRSKETYILYNRIMDESTGNSSYLIDMPNGGLGCVMGNLLMKSNLAENPSGISYGFEGVDDTMENSLFLINNTFLNYKQNGRFAQIKDGISSFKSLVINNLIAGTTNFVSGKYDSVSNLVLKNISDAKLVGPENYDYHLLENSPARNSGENPLDFSQNTHGFYPDFEYRHQADRSERKTMQAIDIGAYEFIEPDTLKLDAPVLINPPNNSTEIAFNPLFSWQPVKDAKLYHLQVATDLQFKNLVIDNADISGTTFQSISLLDNNTYYWRVRANTDTLQSSWSEIWNFRTMVSGIWENNNSSIIKLYPDPVSDVLSLIINEPFSGEVSISILNIFGQTVRELYNGNLEMQTGIHQYDVSNLAKSLYFLKLEANNKIIISKFVIIK